MTPCHANGNSSRDSRDMASDNEPFNGFSPTPANRNSMYGSQYGNPTMKRAPTHSFSPSVSPSVSNTGQSESDQVYRKNVAASGTGMNSSSSVQRKAEAFQQQHVNGNNSQVQTQQRKPFTFK